MKLKSFHLAGYVISQNKEVPDWTPGKTIDILDGSANFWGLRGGRGVGVGGKEVNKVYPPLS